MSNDNPNTCATAPDQPESAITPEPVATPDPATTSDGAKKKKSRVTPAIRERIKELMLANPGISDDELQAAVKISLASLYRVLKVFRSNGELPFRRGHGQTSTAGKKRRPTVAHPGTSDAAAAPTAVCVPESGEAGAEVAATTSLPSEEAIDTAASVLPISTPAEVASVPATAPAPVSFLSRVLSLFVGV